MKVCVGGLLLVWTLLSLQQTAFFASDRALWTRAVRVNPRLARPALNLASTYRNADDAEPAIAWLTQAGELSYDSPRGEEVRAIVRTQLLWWTAFGHDACGRHDVQRFC